MIQENYFHMNSTEVINVFTCLLDQILSIFLIIGTTETYSEFRC